MCVRRRRRIGLCRPLLLETALLANERASTPSSHASNISRCSDKPLLPTRLLPLPHPAKLSSSTAVSPAASPAPPSRHPSALLPPRSPSPQRRSHTAVRSARRSNTLRSSRWVVRRTRACRTKVAGVTDWLLEERRRGSVERRRRECEESRRSKGREPRSKRWEWRRRTWWSSAWSLCVREAERLCGRRA